MSSLVNVLYLKNVNKKGEKFTVGGLFLGGEFWEDNVFSSLKR